MKVLVVDPDRGSRRLVEIAFASSGHQVVAARGVEGAQAEVVMRCPDLIIASLEIGEGDVLTWCRTLRRSLGVRTPWLWAVTNRTQREVQALAKQSGIDLVLVKPVNLVALLAGMDSGGSGSSNRTIPSLTARLQTEFNDRRVSVSLSRS